MQKSQPCFYSAVKARLKSTITSIVKQAKVEYMILVTDQQGFQLICSLFTTVELSILGLNIIHRLKDETRKSRKYDALYLISASDQAIEGLVQDFSDHRFQKYLGAYVLTLSTLAEDHMAKIKGCKNLLTNLMALQEIDMEFFPCQSNVLSLGMKGYFNNRDKPTWTESTVRRIASALLSYWPFDEVEFVHSLKNGKMVEELEKMLNNRIRILKQNDIKMTEDKTPKIKILIVDRGGDWQSPLMRDYHYLPFIYDVYKVKNNLLTFSEKELVSLAPMSSDLFEQIKYLGIAQAGQKVHEKGEQVRNFRNDKQETLGKLANLNSNVKLAEDIAEHTKVIERINNKEGKELMGLTSLQQSIVNGVNTMGQELSDSKIFKLITDFFKQEITINESDYARLYCLCCMSMKLDKNQHKALIVNLSEAEFKDIPKRIEKVTPKPRKLKQKPQGQDIQVLFRHQPELVMTYKAYLNNSLQGYASKIVNFQERRIKDRNLLGGSDSGPKLFMFVDGYLGYNQITALNELPNPNPNERLILASHLVVTPYEYTDELLSISI